jgi:CRP-like cAMP-binding protein
MPSHAPNGAEARRTLYAHFPDFDQVRDLVEPGAQLLLYGAGESLFARGLPLRQLFFLLRGQVEEQGLRRNATGDRQPHLMRTVTPSPARPLPVLGLYDYLYGQRHSTHAVAATDCEVLVISAPLFEKILFHRPELPAALAPLLVYDRLRTIPLLGQLDRIELHYLAEALVPVSAAVEGVIFATANDSLYFIDRGQVEVKQQDGQTVRLGNGAAFGFAGADQRAHSLTESKLFQIEHKTLQSLAPFAYEVAGLALRQLVLDTVQQLTPFSDPVFTADLLARLAGYFSHYLIPVNTILTQQGELSDSMWVLMPGSQALVHALDEHGEALPTTTARGPNFFGEAALLAQATVDSTLEAEAGGQWLRLHRGDFQAFLRTAPARLIDKLKLRGEVQLFIGKQPASERYPWLQEGEGVIWPSRRHWLILIRKTWPALLVLIGVLMSYSGLALIPGWQIGVGAGLAVAGLFALGFFLWGLYDYWNDYIVVTTRRMVLEERVLLQSQRLQETGLEQVRNVDIAKSFVGNLLGYGLLQVHTAGTQGTIAFSFVPEVEEVQRVLINQMNRRRHFRQAATKVEIQHQLEGRLGRRLALPDRVTTGAVRTATVPSNQPPWVTRLTALTAPRRLSRYREDRVVWRKHWIVLVGRLIWPVLIFNGLLMLLMGELIFLPLAIGALLTGTVSFLLFLLLMVDLAVIAWRVADWRNDTYEVTRDEVADVEKLPLFFDEQRRTARLTAIDNIRSEIPSTLHYLLNVGNVRLETAATQGEFTFDSVADPNGVAAEIRRRIEAAQRREEEERAQQRVREMADWFELYDRLKPVEHP